MSGHRVAVLITVLLVLPLSLGSLRAAPAPVTTETLAEAKGISVPNGSSWVVGEIAFRGGERVTHQHGLEFVYAPQGDAALIVGGQSVTVPPGKAVIIPAGASHTHSNPGGSPLRILSFQLGPPEPAWGSLEVVRVKRSGTLSGFRSGAQMARLLGVTIQPQSESAVHTHPGPEGVYVLDGPIVVQNEGKLTILLRGDFLVVPGDTPVQVRYLGATGLGRALAPYVVAENVPFSVAIPGGFIHPPKP